MSDQPPRVLDAPESIWLNYGDLERDYSHAELAASGDVTWCEDVVFVSDVRYARADLFDSLHAQRDELLAAAKPFADLIKATSGRIPYERLALADWHALFLAHANATKDQA